MTTYPLEVSDQLWDRYKRTVSRELKLKEPITDFIEARVNLEGNQRIAVIEGTNSEDEQVEVVREVN